MLKFLIISVIFLSLFSINSSAQYNYVRNGSFEELRTPGLYPDGVTQINRAKYWQNPRLWPGGATPDYFHNTVNWSYIKFDIFKTNLINNYGYLKIHLEKSNIYSILILIKYVKFKQRFL